MIEDWQNGGFGIYVHWPFCEAKCPYCDFNSYVASLIDHPRWQSAYLKELDRYAALTSGRAVQSVFFGGGTPSLMKAETVQAIVDRIATLWPMSNTVEITLEANPSSVEASRFADFAQAGVNRVSLGIQALNDKDLKRLGRLHDTAAALKALEIANARFDRVSFDLIYARQDQGLKDWTKELSTALEMCTGHMSLYQLTIEDGTAFGDRYRIGKLRGLPDEDLAADMFEATQALCDASGFPAYEISNHAAPGEESRHNLIYWRYGDYLGIGPGAHGRLTLDGSRFATEAFAAPGKWLQATEQGCGESLRDALRPEDQATEYLLMALRLHEGLDSDRFERLGGTRLNTKSLGDFTDMGLLERDGPQIRLTGRGTALLNRIAADLLP